MSSHQSGAQTATWGEVPIGVLADLPPRLGQYLSEAWGTNGEADNRAPHCRNGSRFGFHSRRRAVLKTFPHGPEQVTEQDGLLWLIVANYGQGG
ncbi:MAG: hypothetical protein ACRDQ4_16470 [Pseudonocardiaceae bacterium]